MSNNLKRKPSSPSRKHNYDVGYGKPPANGRFKKGQSGNPSGRPKGKKNAEPAWNEERLKDIILQEAYRTITVQDGNRNVTVPMAQAVVRALAVNAARGQHRSQRLFAEILTATERQNKAHHDEWLDTAMTYKVEWDRELERRERLGVTGPEPIPHPDQVKIDMNTGKVWIEGPATKEQKLELDNWITRRDDFVEELRELEALFEDTDNETAKGVISVDIAQTKKVLKIIEGVLPCESLLEKYR